ncbi:unnamed protein product [Arabis nemorensis]|uniref:Uncharacterized protein n=1 Tax=Arabis nemorensis TaxID=586526 RepID=A0A565BTW8_9BRAS|nr:unnamed protein product [Arabis nemorensis]
MLKQNWVGIRRKPSNNDTVSGETQKKKNFLYQLASRCEYLLGMTTIPRLSLGMGYKEPLTEELALAT